jgi:hypothetical protein
MDTFGELCDTELNLSKKGESRKVSHIDFIKNIHAIATPNKIAVKT